MPVIPTDSPDASVRRRDIYLCILLALVTFALYWPVSSFEFNNYDDAQYITENPQVQAGLTGDNFSWAFTTGYASNWHPLTWLSHMLDCQLYGLKAGDHHLTNLFFHIANTLLLFGLLRRLTGEVWRAAFVAALFALHPMHVESVAWVAERKDVLSGFFGLLTLLAWSFYVRNKSPRTYALALLCFALGLMSKPMLVSFPLLMMLLDFWPLNRLQFGKPLKDYWPLLREKIPFFALSLASCVVTFLVQRAGGAMMATEMLPPDKRIADALIAYARYLGKLVWPHDMAVVYPYPAHFLVWQWASAALLLLVATILVLRTASRRPYLTVGWFWFLISLVPVIGLVQVGRQAMADRYTYLPAIGLFMAVIWGLGDFLAGWRPAKTMVPIAAALTLLGCFWGSTVQLQYWRNSIALFSHAIAVTTDNAVAHCNLGQALAAAGKPEEARQEYARALQIDPTYISAMISMSSYYNLHGNYDQAIACLDEALKIRPDSDQAHYNLGLAYSAQGKTVQAVAEFRAAIQANPRHDKALTNLGAILAQQGNSTEAVSLFEQALKSAPNNPYTHNALGGALQSQGKLDDAAREYSAAVDISPDFVEAHENLALLLIAQHRFEDARTQFEAALKSRPGDASLHFEFANALLAAGQPADAATQYSAAVQLKPDFLAAHYNLAGLLARQKQWDAALSHYNEVLRLQPDLADAQASVAIILTQQGNDRGAIEHYRAALRSKPNFVTVQRNLAWLLATSPDATLRDGAEAVRVASAASKLAPGDPTVWDTLAAALAESGNYTQALDADNQALQLANANQLTELAAQIQSRLKLYQAGQPFHRASMPAANN